MPYHTISSLYSYAQTRKNKGENPDIGTIAYIVFRIFLNYTNNYVPKTGNNFSFLIKKFVHRCTYIRLDLHTPDKLSRRFI